MRVVHVTHPTAHLRREGQRLLVYIGKDRQAEIRTHGLEQLVLSGNIAVSPPAMDLLLQKGIDTVFLTGGGRFRGRLTSHISSNIRLRLRQFERLTDGAFALDLAKTIVEGKLDNQRTFLLRRRRRTPGPELDLAARALQAAVYRTRLATGLDETRGCEGSGAAAYFRVFGRFLENPEFRFDGRNRRPPMDPVNALLSLGYTLLFNLVHGKVVRVGLDPYLGALHAPTAGRPSLVCDLVEEFRVPVVDTLVVAAINQRSFRARDFEDQGPGEPVLLRRETMRWMVELFERRVETHLLYAPYDQRLRLHDIIEQQARALARHLLSGDTYAPFRMK